MESAACARLCTRHGVPFGCLRAISDTVDTRLSPRLVSLLNGGQISWWRVLISLCRQPGLLSEFIRLGRDTKVAAARLGKAVGEILTLNPAD